MSGLAGGACTRKWLSNQLSNVSKSISLNAYLVLATSSLSIAGGSVLRFIIQRYHSNMPLIFLISHAQLISPRSVHITRLISNAVCSATCLTWKRVNS